MNVLSLFDGMSCGQIALKRAGISFGKYYAAEVDKYAITVTQANHPDTVQLGDVTRWREWSVDWSSIGLVMGGSPCQGFSFAGKGLAFDDPRSKLFFTFVDILNHIRSVNPNVKFLLENVRMKKEHLSLITKFMGVDPVFINSALVSAQNRQRFYWANWNFEAPEDRGLVLADVIEEKPENVVVMSDRFVERQRGRKCLVTDFSKKASSLSAMEYVKNGRQGDYVVFRGAAERRSSGNFEVRKDEKSNALLANGHKSRLYTGDFTDREKSLPLLATYDRSTDIQRYFQKNIHQIIFRRPRRISEGKFTEHHEKSPAMTATRWEMNNFIGSITNDLFGPIDVKDCKDWSQIKASNCFRKLTPVECERLQTVPDNYTNHVSNTQRYKMLGNGWTVDVIAHILSSRGQNDLFESGWS